MLPTLLSMAGVEFSNPHPLDGIDISGVFSGQMATREKPMGFWHNFQKGQSTWNDRILKAIMEKQQAGASLPHDPPRMQKDIGEFPQFAEGTATGHAAWLDWPWKLHRAKNGTVYELYNLESDPMESVDLSGNPEYKSRLRTMKKELDVWSRSVVGSINGMDYHD